jgi:hypothetical protein
VVSPKEKSDLKMSRVIWKGLISYHLCEPQFFGRTCWANLFLRLVALNSLLAARRVLMRKREELLNGAF